MSIVLSVHLHSNLLEGRERIHINILFPHPPPMCTYIIQSYSYINSQPPLFCLRIRKESSLNSERKVSSDVIVHTNQFQTFLSIVFKREKEPHLSSERKLDIDSYFDVSLMTCKKKKMKKKKKRFLCSVSLSIPLK